MRVSAATGEEMFGLSLLESGVVIAISLVGVGWLVSSCIVAYVARARGRGSGVAWFFVSLFCTPVFAILCLAALAVREREPWEE